MDRTPEEIIGLIFECCPTGPFPQLDPITKPEEIAILNVCRKWKRIALSTPRLWCRIRLRQKPYPTADALSSYLALSGSCSVVMTVHHCSDSRSRRRALTGPDKACIRLILNEMHRCQRAYFHLRWRVDFPIEEMMAQAYRLVDLHLCCERHFQNGPTDAVLVFPGLKYLRISGNIGSEIPLLNTPKLDNLIFDRIITSDISGIHTLITQVAKTLRFLEFRSAYIGKSGEVFDFSHLPPLELSSIVRVFVRMGEIRFILRGYLDYPSHVIPQIKHSFILEFKGLGLPQFMEKVQSKAADCVVLTGSGYPRDIVSLSQALSQGLGALPDAAVIRGFLDGLPNLKHLHVLAFSDESRALIGRVLAEAGRGNSILLSTSPMEGRITG
jgi:hypothetical protein